MRDFATIDLETTNCERTSVCNVGVVIDPLIEGLPLVAHNKSLDESYLKAASAAMEWTIPTMNFIAPVRQPGVFSPMLKITGYTQFPPCAIPIWITVTTHWPMRSLCLDCERYIVKHLNRI